ncbi:MAG: glycoside hydrolase family 99-like domain-containing protein [Rhodopila sp.]|jgi:lipopolysaccharide biosynthesis protein
MKPARLIALYLPQFHPVPENNEWWSPGFTEWTNTAKARPLYPGHYQPHVPADMGFYDLRVPETREDQANLAREHGIEAFCYYHYWFGSGRRILERPFNEVVASGKPDYPFCVCWANETWTGIWHGAPNRVLIEQTYPGDADHRAHFEAMLPAFGDRRHITIERTPVFCIYKPEKLPDPKRTLHLWRTMAKAAGLPGLHVLGMSADVNWSPEDNGYDGKICLPLILTRPWVSKRQPIKWLRRQVAIQAGLPSFHSATRFVSELEALRALPYEWHPCLIHTWDNTPRSGNNGVVLRHASPEQFSRLVDVAVDLASAKGPEHRLVFLKSWNEWAEGNHLEPDRRYGRKYLGVLRDAMVGSAERP